MAEKHSRLKENLYNACKESLEKRLTTISNSLQSIQESKSSDSKSSVGDKYETGRAMLHLEEDKSRRQLLETTQVKNELLKIDLDKNSDTVELGSIVTTNKGIYFISVGIGKIILDEELYYCISTNSPIGAMLLGKKVGDRIYFNTNEIEIEQVK